MKTCTMTKGMIRLLYTSTLLLFFSCQQHESSISIRIATASNMQFATEKIAAQFSKKHNINCEVITSSSGKLMAQIKEGAPYDIFLSADTKYPNELRRLGLTSDIPKVYAAGKLVLWSADTDAPLSLEKLSDTNINHIALANPSTAPYGAAAMSVIKQLPNFKALESKLVFGESISQTNQFIMSKAAEVGFTALAVVNSAQLKNKGKWVLIPDSLYQQIDQAVVLIERNQSQLPEAKLFYDYLFSEDSRKVLKDFGYSVSE